MRIEDIRIGDRVRKELGDISGLAESMKRTGLLHPVVVTSDGLLVAGRRRIEAALMLGKQDVEVTVIDVRDILVAERDENEQRKPFTPTEAVEVGRLIEEQHRARIAAAKPDVHRKAIAVREAKRAGISPVNGRAHAFPLPLGETREVAAKAVGMSGRTYARAKSVVTAAEADPERFGDLPARMDETANITGAYREMQRRRAETDAPAPLTVATPREKHPHRHPIHGKTRLPQHNQMVERAVHALNGTCLGLRLVEVARLDPSKCQDWIQTIKPHIEYLRRFCKELASHERTK